MARYIGAGNSLYHAGTGVSNVPLSMSCWFRRDDTTAGGDGLISVFHESFNQGWFLQAVGGGANRVYATTYAGGNSSAASDVARKFTPNAWHHAGAVFSSNTSRVAYMDGGFKSTPETTSRIPTSVQDINLGARLRSGADILIGAIAEAGIWNIALTDDDMAALGAGVSPLLVRPQNLIHYAPLFRDEDFCWVHGLQFLSTGSPTIAAPPNKVFIRPQNNIIIPMPVTAGGSAALTGTATASITEADIVTGGKTIIITLTGDTFVAAGTGPIGSTADTQALIDGIDSAQSEATGWDAVVKVGIDQADVVRTSSTVCTITLDPESTYDITAQETITATIPAAALTGASPIVASPTFTVDVAAGGFQAAWAMASRRSKILGAR